MEPDFNYDEKDKKETNKSLWQRWFPKVKPYVDEGILENLEVGEFVFDEVTGKRVGIADGAGDWTPIQENNLQKWVYGGLATITLLVIAGGLVKGFLFDKAPIDLPKPEPTSGNPPSDRERENPFAKATSTITPTIEVEESSLDDGTDDENTGPSCTGDALYLLDECEPAREAIDDNPIPVKSEPDSQNNITEIEERNPQIIEYLRLMFHYSDEALAELQVSVYQTEATCQESIRDEGVFSTCLMPGWNEISLLDYINNKIVGEVKFQNFILKSGEITVFTGIESIEEDRINLIFDSEYVDSMPWTAVEYFSSEEIFAFSVESTESD